MRRSNHHTSKIGTRTPINLTHVLRLPYEQGTEGTSANVRYLLPNSDNRTHYHHLHIHIL